MAWLRKTCSITADIIFRIGFIGWLGQQIQPKSFSTFQEQVQRLKTEQLQFGLPALIKRFSRTVHCEKIPVIEMAIIQGQGTLKPFMNIPITARFVFVHNTGNNYRHYFEVTFFGILKVNEGYIDGEQFFESPMTGITNDPNSNQAANLTLWTEGMWFPALWMTDPRVHWELVHANTALLLAPFEKGEEFFLVLFTLETGMIDSMETIPYRDPGEKQPKTLWIGRNEPGQPAAESSAYSVGTAMWLDQGSPWAYFDAEEITLNMDVSNQILLSGYTTEP